MRHQRWVVLTFVVAGILAGVIIQQAAASAFLQFTIPNQRFGAFSTTSLIAIVSGVVTSVVLLRNQRVVTFTTESIDELSKVTWPSREETLRATTTVVVTTAIVSGLLGAYDYIWKKLANLFILT